MTIKANSHPSLTLLEALAAVPTLIRPLKQKYKVYVMSLLRAFYNGGI